MQIKEGFILKRILDDYIVVPTGDNIVDFAVAVSLNESGAFLWEKLQGSIHEQELVEALMKEYEGLDEKTAQADVAEFLAMLVENGFLQE